MGGLVKLYEKDVIEPRLEHGARIVFEYQHPQPAPKRDETTNPFLLTPTQLREFRAFVQRANRECEERLAREMVMAYKLNKERTFATSLGFITKGEAAKATGVGGGMLLDLDNLYGGVLAFVGYLFISEGKLTHGVHTYGPDAFIDGLISERLAA